jgi:hypothetical protein
LSLANINVKTEKTIFIGAFAAVSAKYFDRPIVEKVSKPVLALKSTNFAKHFVPKRVSMNVGIEPG